LKKQPKVSKIEKKKEHYVNLMLINTVEAVLLGMAFVMVYRALNTVPDIMYMRTALIWIGGACAAAAAALGVISYMNEKTKLYFHACFLLLLTFDCFFIRFGSPLVRFLRANQNSNLPLYIAVLVSAMYILGAYIWLFIKEKNVK